MEAVYPSMSAFIHLANTFSLSAMCRTMCYPPGDAEMTGLMRRSGWAGQREASFYKWALRLIVVLKCIFILVIKKVICEILAFMYL